MDTRAAGAAPPAGGQIEGRCLAAGAQSRELLAGLLGLAETGGRYAVQAVAWLDHALEAGVTLPDGEQVVFRIERRSEDAAGLVVTEMLVLYYRAKTVPRDLLEAVTARAPQRLAEHSLESLAARIAEDPELGDPALPLPPGVDAGERPRSLLDTWGDRRAWADFFAGGELARAQLDSLDPGALFTFVQHSDCECLHVNPHGGGPVIWLVNYPWDDRLRHGRPAVEQRDLSAAACEGMITSDLDENDVIMGNPDKLRRLLAEAERVSEASGKALFFSNTCTPVVTGEDVESEIARFRRRTGREVLYLTVTPRSMVNVFHEVLVDRRLRAEARCAAPRPRSVNLVGFRDDPEVAELRELLGLVDVSVNCVLLPDLTFERIDALPEAALNVFYPNQLWQHLYDQLQFSSRIPHISPRAPFGLAASGRWVEEVAAHFGLTEAQRGALDARLAEWRPRYRAACRPAAEQRLGFVLRSDETRFLTRPAATWGVPLVELLEEMGFGLEVYLQVTGRRSARQAALEVQSAFGRPERHLIQAFDTFERMQKRLADSRAAAFFSSHFFDWRITQAGKNLFSLQHFEMGPRGAIRTAERLVGVCRTPFYRKYARFLARSAEGLRREGD